MGKFADELAPKFADAPSVKPQNVKHGTIAWVIVRFIEKKAASGKPLGDSAYYALFAMARDKLGAVMAAKLDESDIMDFVERRYEAGLNPATISGDISRLRVALKYARSAWKKECPGISDKAIEEALPLLVKDGWIGKSKPRTRLPTGDELERLIAYLSEQDAGPRTKVKVVPCLLFALATTRRRGEIVRLMYGDIEWDHKDEKGNAAPRYMIRDVKHPTAKKGNHKWFPLFDDAAEIIRRQPRLRPNDPTERVFPYDGKSVGARYTLAKKELGIVDLRFHDNRAAGITRFLKFLPPHEVKLISGHTGKSPTLERVYDRRDGDYLHAKLRTLMLEAPQ